MLCAPDGNLRARLKAKFGQDVLDMRGHGRLAHDQTHGNATVAIAPAKQGRHLLLPGAESFEIRGTASGGLRRRGSQRLGDRCVERERAALDHGGIRKRPQGFSRRCELRVEALLGDLRQRCLGLLAQRGGSTCQAERSSRLPLGRGYSAIPSPSVATSRFTVAG